MAPTRHRRVRAVQGSYRLKDPDLLDRIGDNITATLTLLVYVLEFWMDT